MSTTPRDPSEDELQAFVDDRLDPARTMAVRDWLAAHPETQRMVRDYRSQNRAIGDAFAPLLDRRVPERLLALGETQAPGGRVWRAAAMVAMVAAAGAAGWFANDVLRERVIAGPAVAREGVSAHRVYEVEVRHPVEVGADEEAHLVAWLSKRLDAPVRAPELADRGYRLVGGRLLPADHGPAAQFMYETPAGERLTLYVERNRTGEQTAFRFVDEDGVSAFYWKEGPLAYALIGRSGREALLEVARSVYAQLAE